MAHQACFEDVTLGKQITEHFINFSDKTLIDKKPIPNWPLELGKKASEIIRESGSRKSREVKVLVVHGGVGRTTLELLRHCDNLRIDHSDRIGSGVLKSLLDQSRIQWHQQLEGSIVELKEFNHEEGESGTSLLTDKNNSVTFWKVDYNSLDPELKDYDVIVADFRYKDSASDLDHILKRLKPGENYLKHFLGWMLQKARPFSTTAFKTVWLFGRASIKIVCKIVFRWSPNSRHH